MTSTSQTLAERIASGRIPVMEALRIGTLLADQLRRLHEQGATHGALTPSMVAVIDNSVQLLFAAEPADSITPYTAPELLEGEPADPRSDIFAFGAIFYEVVTGVRAFDGENLEDLSVSLTSAEPLPSGSPAVDRLVSACVAKSRDCRYQRVHKLLLELRLLTSAVRRSAQPEEFVLPSPVAPVPPVREEPAAASETIDGQQIRELEDRIAARFQEQEKSVASVAQIANEVLRTLRGQQAGGVPSSRPHLLSVPVEPLEASNSHSLERTINLLHDKLSRLDLVLATAVERLQRLEHNLNEFDTDGAALRDSVTRDIRSVERTLKSQATAIESVRTAMGQTDDLVERVVEALDSMQPTFVPAPEQRMLAS